MSKKLRLQIGIFTLISLLGISFVGIKYLGWMDSSYTVTLQSDDTGGAYEYAAVAYRGVPVGTVGRVQLSDDGKGASIELKIDEGVKVPTDVDAVVAHKSAVGEQYVDLRPKSSGGPYLTEGDVIKGAQLPLPMEVLLSNLDGLLETVDPEDLSIVVDELGKAFQGNEDSLKKLLDATQALVDGAHEHIPETTDLIRDGKTVLDTQVASAAAIETWASELAKLTTTVAESDDDIRSLIDEAPPAARKVTDTIEDLDPSLGVLLGNLITVNGVMVRRLPNIETTLVTYPMVIAGGFTVTPGDGTAHFGLALNFDNPPPCIYGDEGETCTQEELEGGSSVRGWQNAPDPTGPPIKPVPLPKADNSGEEPPESDQDSSDGEEADGDSGKESESSDFAYDPLTGLLVDTEGNPIQFGSTGGQYELAGEQSWKQLLLTGVT